MQKYVFMNLVDWKTTEKVSQSLGRKELYELVFMSSMGIISSTLKAVERAFWKH